MSDVRRETIGVAQLEIGMYVSDLDRPWLDTPFMLQGFLLEEQKQIDTIRQLCHTVVIDRTRSTIEHYKKNVSSPDSPNLQDATIVHAKSPIPGNPVQYSASTRNVSFFDVFSELVAAQKTNKSQKSKKNSPSTLERITSELHYHADTNVQPQQTSIVPEPHVARAKLKGQAKEEVKGLFDSFTGWFRSGTNKDKLSSGASSPRFSSTQQESKVATGPRITIYQDAVPVEQEIIAVAPVYEKTQIATRAAFEAIANESNVDLSQVHESLDQMVESIERNPDALMWLSKLKQTDNYTYNHALSVSVNLMAMAQFMALPKYQVKELGMAGLLQDIGKVNVDQDLLNKTETITPEERITLQNHVNESIGLLEKVKGISPPVLYTIEQHHERYDGSGYPKQLKGKEISLQGQLAGIIDSYCAMTTDKPYAKGLFNQEALDEIYSLRDIRFSAVLVEQLVQFMGIYPVSSLVELNTGEIAVVVEQNHVRRMKPRLMVLLAPDKTRNPYPPTLDLINSPKTPSGEPYKIVRGIPPYSHGLNPDEFYM